MLRHALTLAEGVACYHALMLARRVMLHEQDVLGLAAPASARQEAARRPALAETGAGHAG
jgi:hypothetical protein